MKRAIFIEDHALFRESLSLLLKWKMDIDSVEAGSLEEGRQVLSDLPSKADIAIINVDLPDGDGSELIEQLHEATPDVPVLALTDNQSSTQQARALGAGADEVLAKATPVEQIIAAVERIRHH